MIREFWAENYKSIRDRQVLNFECKGNDDSITSVEVSKGIWINKLGIIYGANASGKSNILYALQNVFDILYFAQVKKEVLVKGEGPFALNASNPTTLFVSFYADKIRYDYKVVYYPSYIVSEELFFYPNGSKALFYERTFTSVDTNADIRFGNSLKLLSKSIDAITQSTLNNHSVLSSFSKVALGEDTKNIATLYNWIGEFVHEVNGDYIGDFSSHMGKVYSDEKKKSFYLQLLKKADLNIQDFVYSQKEVPIRVNKSIGHEMMIKVDDVTFLNRADDGIFYINNDNQSKGTKRFLMIIDFLYDMVIGNHIYMMDELDVELHYDLLLFFLNVFLYNTNESQLIFTSQEILLLKEDLINENRNLIWFAEKSSNTAASKYTRADQLGLHKNLSLFNSYKTGKLGSIPSLGSFFLDVDNIR
ncbi:MAG: AAA family ATPase [Bacteroidaceae bacterium]|nr:AAA family ATPase [Bacteroidaceae bacterium]